MLVERPLELPEAGLDQLVFLDGADAVVSDRGVGGAASDAQAECQRPRLRRNHAETGRLEHVSGIRAMTTIRHGEAADAAVLFADDALDDQPAAQGQPAFLQGGGRADRDRQSGLHVAGAASVEATGVDVRRPGRRMPGLAITGRDDVDVPVENQGPAAFLTEQTGHQDRLAALHLHPGKTRMRFEPAEVGVEPVDLEARFFERQGYQILHRALIASD